MCDLYRIVLHNHCQLVNLSAKVNGQLNFVSIIATDNKMKKEKIEKKETKSIMRNKSPISTQRVQFWRSSVRSFLCSLLVGTKLGPWLKIDIFGVKVVLDSIEIDPSQRMTAFSPSACNRIHVNTFWLCSCVISLFINEIGRNFRTLPLKCSAPEKATLGYVKPMWTTLEPENQFWREIHVFSYIHEQI